MNARVLPFETRRENDTAIDLAHELRSSLNGIQTWVRVLQGALETADPIAARAIQGILAGVEQQVRLIETLERPAPPRGKD